MADRAKSADNEQVFEIVLNNPEIPPNTGAIIRLCANTGARLHLVEPLGFELSDKRLRRAGLDYHDMACVEVYPSWAALRAALAGGTWYAFSSHAKRSYERATFSAGDVLVFGAESQGLPSAVLEEFAADETLRVPMVAGSRSLNLANAASVVVYEGWRQLGFPGSE
jgi:tRNA (cytidine/uridine-2'-O-)-methyltransferase